jgi:hypothetical protein
VLEHSTSQIRLVHDDFEEFSCDLVSLRCLVFVPEEVGWDLLGQRLQALLVVGLEDWNKAAN